MSHRLGSDPARQNSCFSLHRHFHSKDGGQLSVESLDLAPHGVVVRRRSEALNIRRALAVPFVFAAVLVAAFGFLAFHQDPATLSTPDGGGSSSNIVTNVEAFVSLVAMAAVVLGAMFWSHRSVE